MGRALVKILSSTLLQARGGSSRSRELRVLFRDSCNANEDDLHHMTVS